MNNPHHIKLIEYTTIIVIYNPHHIKLIEYTIFIVIQL